MPSVAWESCEALCLLGARFPCRKCVQRKSTRLDSIGANLRCGRNVDTRSLQAIVRWTGNRDRLLPCRSAREMQVRFWGNRLLGAFTVLVIPRLRGIYTGS